MTAFLFSSSTSYLLRVGVSFADRVESRISSVADRVGIQADRVILRLHMENVVATQAEFSGPTRVTRNLEERLIVRFPGLFRRLSALIYRRLSRDSRLRRALLRRQVVSGWAAVNRRD